VEGEIFWDLNGDGIRQKTEPVLPGVHVTLNDSRREVTDAEGKFYFKPVKGEIKLQVELLL
jgi:hypothetical protein